MNTQVKRGMRAMIVRIRGAAHLPLDRSWPIEGGPHVRVFEVLEVDDDGVAQVLLHVTADQAEKLAHLGPEPLRLEGARVLQAQLSGPVAPSAGAYVQPGDIPVVVVDVGAASPQGIHEVRVVPVRRGEPRDRLATLDLAGIYTLEHAEGPRFHWDHHGGCLDLEELRRKTGYR